MYVYDIRPMPMSPFIYIGSAIQISIESVYVHQLTHLSPYSRMGQGIQEWTK